MMILPPGDPKELSRAAITIAATHTKSRQWRHGTRPISPRATAPDGPRCGKCSHVIARPRSLSRLRPATAAGLRISAHTIPPRSRHSASVPRVTRCPSAGTGATYGDLRLTMPRKPTRDQGRQHTTTRERPMNEAQHVRSSMPQLTERQTRTGAHNEASLCQEVLSAPLSCVVYTLSAVMSTTQPSRIPLSMPLLSSVPRPEPHVSYMSTTQNSSPPGLLQNDCR